MSEHFENEKELYYHKSREPRLYFFHVEAEPDKPWDYEYLFQKNIYPGLGKEKAGVVERWIDVFPKKELNFEILSQHPFLNIRWFHKFPDAPWNLKKINTQIVLNWDFSKLSNKYYISSKWLKTFPDANWDFKTLSCHHNMCLNWVKIFPDAPWDFNLISCQVSEPVKWLRKFPNKNWNFQHLQYYHDVTLELIKLIPESQIDFDYLVNFVNITPEWVKQFPDAPWNFTKLSMLSYLSLEWLDSFPEADWTFLESDWEKIKNDTKSENEREKFRISGRNFRYENDMKHSNVKNFYSIIHGNFKISWFKRYPNLKWDFRFLSEHDVSLTLKVIQNNPDKPWDFKLLSRNYNLELSWIKTFPKAKWDLNQLFEKFSYTNILVLYQFDNPDICVMENISSYHRMIYSSHLNLYIPLMLLNPKNKTYFAYELKRLGCYETQELNEVEKINVVRLTTERYDFTNFYPEVIYHIDKPLELQDLSGDIYYIPGWFESDDILGLARETFPELGRFEIIINRPEEEKDFYAMWNDNYKFKQILLSLVDGPFGMLSYSHYSPSLDEEDELPYFEEWEKY